VHWANALVEEAVAALAAVAGERQGFICDSYDADAIRKSNAGAEGTTEKVVEKLAQDFNRAPFRHKQLHVVRHYRWFDLGLANQRSPEAEGRRRVVQILRASGGRAGSTDRVFKVTAVRTTLLDLTRSLERAVGQRHRVDARLERRQITAFLPNATAAEVRECLTIIHPDSRWVQREGVWRLEEAPNAELVRELLSKFQRGLDTETAPEAALLAQVASDLAPQQAAAFRRNGSLTISWSGMSPTSHSLFSQWGTSFLGTVVRSGGTSSHFADFSRTADLGITIGWKPDGSVKFSSFGRNPNGVPVVW
jgi:hypothetical protein